MLEFLYYITFGVIGEGVAEIYGGSWAGILPILIGILSSFLLILSGLWVSLYLYEKIDVPGQPTAEQGVVTAVEFWPAETIRQEDPATQTVKIAVFPQLWSISITAKGTIDSLVTEDEAYGTLKPGDPIDVLVVETKFLKRRAIIGFAL